MTINNTNRIVILGAGIGGLRVALELEKKLHSKRGKIVLVDENNYHQYLYRIHEVCGLEYEEKNIIVPLSKLIDGKNIQFKNLKVESIHTKRKFVETSRGVISYDILVIALGSHPTFFRVKGAEERSRVLNSFRSAKRIRYAVENLFKRAEGSGRLPKIVVAGGGFTGTELAGEFIDWLPVLVQRYNLPVREVLATIVEAMPNILPGWKQELSEKAQEVLNSRGIKIILGDPISTVLEDGLVLKSGRKVESDLTIWTCGVECNPVCAFQFEMASGRIKIDDYCRAIGFKEVYVVGDASCAIEAKTGLPLPPSAHIAMVQADIVSINIHASLTGGEMKRYVGNQVGEIVTLGRAYALGELLGFKLYGFLAKVMKRFIHWWYVRSIGGIRLLLRL